MKPETIKEQISRFLQKVEVANSCWIWHGANDGRYGESFYNGKKIKAHRLAWMLFKGEIPEGMQVCHHCDNPPCINPYHLFLGTMKDNIQDCKRKRRLGAYTHPEKIPRGDKHGARLHPETVQRGDRHWSRLRPELRSTGEKCGTSKLTNEQVEEIRQLAVEGIKLVAIAAKYHVHPDSISNITRGRTWANG